MQRSKLDKLGGGGTICYAVEGIWQRYPVFQKPSIVFDRLNVFSNVDNREIKG